MSKRSIKLILAALILLLTVLAPTSETKAIGVLQRNTPVAGGMSHSIALKNDGTIWTWGSNQQLQLGKEAKIKNQSTPKQVEDISSIISVCAGYDFSLALRYDGRVFVLGVGGDTPIYEAPGLSGIVAIAAGQTDGLALDKDGLVWQWSIGEKPQKVSKLSNVATIAAGGAHFFALTFSGEVWAWGVNWSGQLGDGTMTDAEEPKKVEGLANIVCIAAGYSHSLAVAQDGSVYAWGSNTYGQLGDGTTSIHLSPIKVKGISNAIQVSAGNETSIVLTREQEIYTWGHGEYGQLGNNTATISQDAPATIETEFTPIYIASGVYHCFCISNEGDLYVWGRNRNNTLGTGKDSNEIQPCKLLYAMTYDVEYNTDPFADASEWAAPELSKLYAMNLLPPMLWGSYTSNVTRAEFASLLVCIYEEIKEAELTYPNNIKFTDIEDHVYNSEIRKAYAIEMVGGVSEARFNPEGKITRQEAAKMICTFIAIMEGSPPPEGLRSLAFYKDASKVAAWAVPFVAFAYDNDIMLGSGGNFNPLNNLTREQILAMVYRTIQKYGWI